MRCVKLQLQFDTCWRQVAVWLHHSTPDGWQRHVGATVASLFVASRQFCLATVALLQVWMCHKLQCLLAHPLVGLTLANAAYCMSTLPEALPKAVVVPHQCCMPAQP